jgi:hypothetical protein
VRTHTSAGPDLVPAVSPHYWTGSHRQQAGPARPAAVGNHSRTKWRPPLGRSHAVAGEEKQEGTHRPWAGPRKATRIIHRSWASRRSRLDGRRKVESPLGPWSGRTTGRKSDLNRDLRLSRSMRPGGRPVIPRADRMSTWLCLPTTCKGGRWVGTGLNRRGRQAPGRNPAPKQSPQSPPGKVTPAGNPLSTACEPA